MSITRNQLIHVGVEVLALSSVFLILNNKISHLCERIDDLEKIIKDQNDTIKQHEEVILELVVNLNNLRSNISTQSIKPKIETPKKVVIIATPPEIEEKSKETKIEEIIDDIPIPKKIDDNKIDDDTSSSVLDKELEEELKDLS